MPNLSFVNGKDDVINKISEENKIKERESLNVHSNEDQEKNVIPAELLIYKEKIPLFISINIPDDSEIEINNLHKTLKCIQDSLSILKADIGIESRHILIFLFFENIKQKSNFSYLFPNLEVGEFLENSKNGIYTGNCFYYDYMQKSQGKSSEDCLNIIGIYKYETSKFQSQKVFLNGFCNSLKKPFQAQNQKENDLSTYNAYFAFQLENGITFEQSAINKFICMLCYSKSNGSFCMNENMTFAVMGNILYTNEQHQKCSIFASAQRYDALHYSTYELPFANRSSRCPIDNRCCMLKVTENIQNLLIEYFNKNSEVDFDIHSEQLPNQLIYSNLNKNNIITNYLSDCLIYKDNSTIDFADYMKEWTSRKTSNLQNVFFILYSILTFKKCCRRPHVLSNLANRAINLLSLYGSLFEFILPGLFTLVIYTIFYESFGSLYGGKPTVFFTVFYSVTILLTAFYSLITDKIKNIKIVFQILHFVNTIFYLFILINSIVAIHHLKIDDGLTSLYKFDAVPFAVIIALNFVFGIVPLIFNWRLYKMNILNGLYYLIGGVSSNTSLFLIFSIFNVYKHKHEYQKAIFIFAFLLANLFFGYLILILDTRVIRVNCVLGLASIYTIYHLKKMLLVIWDYVYYYCFTRKHFDYDLSADLKREFLLKYPIDLGKDFDKKKKQIEMNKKKIDDNRRPIVSNPPKISQQEKISNEIKLKSNKDIPVLNKNEEIKMHSGKHLNSVKAKNDNVEAVNKSINSINKSISGSKKNLPNIIVNDDIEEAEQINKLNDNHVVVDSEEEVIDIPEVISNNDLNRKLTSNGLANNDVEIVVAKDSSMLSGKKSKTFRNRKSMDLMEGENSALKVSIHSHRVNKKPEEDDDEFVQIIIDGVDNE